MVKYIDCSELEFYNLTTDKKIICIGAGPMFQKTVRNMRIIDKIEYLLDNNRELHNTTMKILDREIEIKSISFLNEIDVKNIIILITTRYYESVRKQLEQVVKKDLTVAVYIWLKMYVNKSKDYDAFVEKRIIEPATAYFEEYLKYLGKEETEINELVSEKRKHIIEEVKKGRVIIPKIGVRHKSNCTLRCKDCSMLIPYIKEPYYISAEQVIRDLELFFESVDECISVGISDGEPFLDKELDKILEWLIGCDKIISVSFNTNGTILPKQELIPYLKHEKVFVRISDYGYISDMARLIELFEENGIKFSILSEIEWFDSGKGEKYNRTKEELKYAYMRCGSSLCCKILVAGGFYDCERCFRMERLNIKGYDASNDKIILENYTSDDRRIAIWEMYLKESSYGCEFCDLAGVEAKIIEAGIQLDDKMRRKSQYTFVKRRK